MAVYDIARGTRDFLPQDMVVRNHVEYIIRNTFESYGFQQIQTPIFERFELLAARSGEEIRESMFTFVSDREEYALRPELTAPVCRVIASGKLSKLPVPYKLYYIGQCFRYCRPQAGRYREFTQAGLELMGSKDPIADAEVIAIAVKTLKNLGIDQYKVKIGNIGIFRGILEKEYSDDYDKQSRVINNIDHIMSVWEKCDAIKSHASFNQEDFDFIKVETESLYRIQEDIGYSGEHEILPVSDLGGGKAGNNDQQLKEKATDRLNMLSLAIESTYRALWSKENIVSEKVAALLIDIARMRGKYEEIIPKAEKLLSGTPTLDALEQLSQVSRFLLSFGVADFDIVLGVARGLDFYTDTVFEIDSPLLGAQKQICGGGRYDKLVEEFGGISIPATGFAFGFDRIIETFIKTGKAVDLAPVSVFVANVDDSCKFRAVEVADSLRSSNFRASVDLLGLSLRDQLGYASKIGAEFAVIVGPDELKEDKCKLRQLETRFEEIVPLSALVDKIKDIRKSGK
ncbi:MAG: histidine--tRNA ligase family protein [Deltaproteobacteria bacterium]|uniref:Histidine--tRNA ligase n=1 Tax=Candidatus Zymogenus saltonus TaxID=2844893 RepID=A0A9D8KG83_9DELT|nr:histidine--tRNA ligase family protein [Candidatus Zymogenus saltonus]